MLPEEATQTSEEANWISEEATLINLLFCQNFGTYWMPDLYSQKSSVTQSAMLDSKDSSEAYCFLPCFPVVYFCDCLLTSLTNCLPIIKANKSNNMTRATNRWACKWLTSFCGIGTMLVLYKHQKHSKCPWCNADDESVVHVLQCPDIQAQQLWKEEIDKIGTWIKDNKGCPELAHAIVTHLNNWHTGSE